MTRRLSLALFAGVLAAGLWSASAAPARAQSYGPSTTPLTRYYYYPYWYFPHNYWPTMSPRWPDPRMNCSNGCFTARPPAYMAFPPFIEPNWRYEMFEHQYYHRGFHFWLDEL